MADDEYQKKVRELQKYVPFLENTIRRLKGDSDKPREAQVTKLQSLLEILTDPKKKLKYDALKKCEEVILKLYSKRKQGESKMAGYMPTNKFGPSFSGDIQHRLGLTPELATPASPSPPLETPLMVPKPVVIPTEQVVDKSTGRFCIPATNTLNESSQHRNYYENNWTSFDDTNSSWRKLNHAIRSPQPPSQPPPQSNFGPPRIWFNGEPLYQRRSDIARNKQSNRFDVWNRPHEDSRLRPTAHRELINYSEASPVSPELEFKTKKTTVVQPAVADTKPGPVTSGKSIEILSDVIDITQDKRKREPIRISFNKPILPKKKVDIPNNLDKPPLSESDLQDLLSCESSSPREPAIEDDDMDLEKLEDLRKKICKELNKSEKSEKHKEKTKSPVKTPLTSPTPISHHALKPKSPRVVERVVKEQDNIFGNVLSSIDEKIMELKKEHKKSDKKDSSKKEDTKKPETKDKDSHKQDAKHKDSKSKEVSSKEVSKIKETKSTDKDQKTKDKSKYKDSKDSKTKDISSKEEPNASSKTLNIQDISKLNEKIKQSYFKCDPKSSKKSESDKSKDISIFKDDSKSKDSKHKKDDDSNKDTVKNKEDSKLKTKSENKQKESLTKTIISKVEESSESIKTSSKEEIQKDIRSSIESIMKDSTMKEGKNEETVAKSDKCIDEKSKKEEPKIITSGRLSDKYPHKRKLSIESKPVESGVKASVESPVSGDSAPVSSFLVADQYSLKLTDPRIRNAPVKSPPPPNFFTRRQSCHERQPPFPNNEFTNKLYSRRKSCAEAEPQKFQASEFNSFPSNPQPVGQFPFMNEQMNNFQGNSSMFNRPVHYNGDAPVDNFQNPALLGPRSMPFPTQLEIMPNRPPDFQRPMPFQADFPIPENRPSLDSFANNLNMCNRSTPYSSDQQQLVESPRTPMDNFQAGSRTPMDNFSAGSRTPMDNFQAGSRTPMDNFQAGSRTPMDNFQAGSRTPMDNFQAGSMTPADPFLMPNQTQNFEQFPMMNRNNSTNQINVYQHQFNSDQCLKSPPQLNHTNQFWSHSTQNQTDQFHMQHNQFERPQNSFSNQSKSFQNIQPNQLNQPRFPNHQLISPRFPNRLSPREKNFDKSNQYDLSKMTPVDFYDHSQESDKSSDKRIPSLLDLKYEYGTNSGGRPFRGRGGMRGSFRGRASYNRFASTRYQNDETRIDNRKHSEEPGEQASTEKGVKEAEKHEEVFSPLNSLYAKEMKKVGKGYGIQKFKIPKIKRNAAEDVQEDVKVVKKEIIPKSDESQKKPEITVEEEKKVAEQNEVVAQPQLSGKQEESEKLETAEASLKSEPGTSREVKSEADDKVEMFNTFMKQIVDSSNTKIFMEFLERIGIKLPEKSKPKSRILSSDSEDNAEEPKKETKTIEETDERKTSEKETMKEDEKEDDENIDAVVETVGERIKSRRRQVNSSPYKLNSSRETDDESKKNDEGKKKLPKPKRRNALELLQDDLREMFICEGVLTATGQRMCRIMKEHQDSVLNYNIRISDKDSDNEFDADDDIPLNRRKFNLRSEKGKIVKAELERCSTPKLRTSPRVVLEQTDVSKFTHAEDTSTLKGEADEEEIEKEMSNLNKKPVRFTRRSESVLSLSPPKWPVKRQRSKLSGAKGTKKRKIESSTESLNEIYDDDDDMSVASSSVKDKSEEIEDALDDEIKTEKPIKKQMKKKNKRRNWALGVIKKKPVKQQKTTVPSITPDNSDTQSHTEENITESDTTAVEKEDVLDNGKVDSFIVDTKPDVNYHLSNSKKYDCRLCPYQGKFIVNHYRTKHRDSENLISRLSPAQAESAKTESKTRHFNEIQSFEEMFAGKKRRSTFWCRFCSLVFKQDVVSNFFDHLCSHTGEYRYACVKCSFFTSLRKTLIAHYHNVHPSMKKTYIITPSYEAPPNFRIVFGYMCAACNYVQLLRENTDKHIEAAHPDQIVEVIKVSLSSKPAHIDDLLDDIYKDVDADVELKAEDENLEKSEDDVPEREDAVALQPSDEVDKPAEVAETNEKEKSIEPPKEPDMTVFMVPEDISEREKLIEDERIKKMQEVISHIAPRRSALQFVDRLKDKLANAVNTEDEDLTVEQPARNDDNRWLEIVNTCSLANEETIPQNLKTSEATKPVTETGEKVEQLTEETTVEHEDTESSSDEPIDVASVELNLPTDSKQKGVLNTIQRLAAKLQSPNAPPLNSDAKSLDQQSVASETSDTSTSFKSVCTDGVIDVGAIEVRQTGKDCIYICKDCGYSTVYKTGFRKHCTDEHSNVKFTCRICCAAKADAKEFNLNSLFVHLIDKHRDTTSKSDRKPEPGRIRIRRISGDVLSNFKSDNETAGSKVVAEKPVHPPDTLASLFQISNVRTLTPEEENKLVSRPDPEPAVVPQLVKIGTQNYQLLISPSKLLLPVPNINKVPKVASNEGGEPSPTLKAQKTQKLETITSLQKIPQSLKPFDPDDMKAKKDMDVLVRMLKLPKILDLYKCPVRACDFTTNKRLLFSGHLKEHGPMADSQFCLYCNSTLRAANLVIHLEVRHGHCLYQCGLCFYRGYCESYMVTHQKNCHNDVRNFIKLTPYKGIRKDPYLDHTLPRAHAILCYVCKQGGCDCSFVLVEDFLVHLRAVHKNHVECSLCLLPMRFTNARSLIKHYLKHSIGMYQCRYCRFATQTPDLMHEHYSKSHPTQGSIAYIRRYKDSPSVETNHINDIDRLPDIEEVHLEVINTPVALSSTDLTAESTSDLINVEINNVRAPAATDPAYLEPLVTVKHRTAESKNAIANAVDPLFLDIDTSEFTNATQSIHETPNSTITSANAIDSTDQTNALQDTITLYSSDLQNANSVVIRGSEILQQTTTALRDEVIGADNVFDHTFTFQKPTNMAELRIYKNSQKGGNSQNFSQSINNADTTNEEEDAITVNSTAEETNKEENSPEDYPNNTDKNVDDIEIIETLENTVDQHESGDQSKTDTDNSDVIEISATSDTDSGLTGHDLFRCGTFGCAYTAANEKEFRAHIYRCDVSKIDGCWYHCAHCPQRFKFAGGLSEHLQTHSAKRFSCSLCSARMMKSHTIEKHMKLKHKVCSVKLEPVDPNKTNKNADFFIAVAIKSGPKKDSINILEPIVTLNEDKTVFGPDEIELLPRRPVYMQEVKCKLCLYSTKVRTNILRHLQAHIDEKAVPETAPVNPVPCLEKNEKMFDKMTNLAASSHTGRMGSRMTDKVASVSKEEDFAKPEFIPANKRFVCGAEGCNYLTHNEAMLKHHFTALHLDETSYKCPHCGSQLRTEAEGLTIDNIIKHLKMHDLNLYKCIHCSYLHYQKSKIDKHLSDKHPDRIPYITVVRELELSANLGEEHKPETTDQKDFKPWRCGLCSFQTHSRTNVQKHAANIHGIKSQFKCGMCHFRCSAKNNYQSHFKTKHPTHEVKIIAVYYKVNERLETTLPYEPVPELETFDTTPLWSRDKPRIRHIRGILLEETGKTTKKSTPKSPEKSVTEKSDKSAIETVGIEDSTNEILEVEVINVKNTSNELGSATKLPEKYGSPNSDDYVCPFCSTYRNNGVQEFIQHLSSEMAYYRCVCNYCGYKSVNAAQAKKHHAAIHSKDGKEESVTPLRPNSKIEAWIDQCVHHQYKEMRENATTNTQTDQPDKVPAPANTETTASVSDSEVSALNGNYSAGFADVSEYNLVELGKHFLGIDEEVVTITDSVPIITNKLQCEHCSFVAKTQQTLRKHIKRHFTHKPFQCTYCHYQAFYDWSIKQHVSTKHRNQAMKYKVVPAPASPAFRPLKHKRSAQEIRETIAAGKRASTDNSLQMTDAPGNVQEPEDKEICIFICYHCPKRSDNLEMIKTHILDSHEKTHRNMYKYKKLTIDKSRKAKYNCKYCTWSGSPDGLKQHHMEEHNDQPYVIERSSKYRCSICDETYTRIANLKRHFSASHPYEPLSYKTIIDGEECVDNVVVMEEPIVKLENRGIGCDFCTETFDTLTGLMHHHNSLHPSQELRLDTPIDVEMKKYKCPRCEHSSNSYPAMRDHIRSHYKPFKCHYCPLTGSYPSIIKTHHVKEHRNLKYQYEKNQKAQKMIEELRDQMLVLNADGIYQPRNLAVKRRLSESDDQPASKIIVLDPTVLDPGPSTSGALHPLRKAVARKSTASHPTKKLNLAKKSTSRPAKSTEDGYSYYGRKPPDKEEYKNVIAEINIMGKSRTINFLAMSLVLNLFPTVPLVDIYKHNDM